MISHKFKYIFVHIPKTGGRSIEQAFLKDYGFKNRLDAKVFEVFDIFPDGEERKKLHSTGIFPDHKLLSEYDIPKNYNSFTVIRDPIDRAVSFYGWFAYTKYNTFTEFCKDIKNYKINNWFGMMTRNQVDFVIDKNGNEIDHIVNIENIHNFCKDKFNFDIPHLNKSKIQKSEIEVTDESKDVLRKIYKQDYEYFNF